MPEPTTIATSSAVPTASAVALRARSRSIIRSGESGAQSLEAIGNDPPDHPPTSLLTREESGVGQDLGVVTDRRLRLAQRRLEIAGTHLSPGRDQTEQAQPDGVAKRGEQ